MKLILDRVHHRYGKLWALEEVNLKLSQGIIGVLGPNGAGKSTLFKVLAGILPLQHGRVTLADAELKGIAREYRRQLGYMPQQQSLYPGLKVHEYLDYVASLKELPVKGRKKEIEGLLEEVRLSDKKKAYTQELPGGMKQRLLLAQALMGDPKLLLLDEPTAGLDPAERSRLRSIISRRKEGKIILLATHMVSDVAYIAESLLLLKKGQIVKEGEQAKILEDLHVQESYLEPNAIYELDPEAVLTSILPHTKVTQSRVISAKKVGEKVAANLDDVYVYYLGETMRI